MGGVVKGAKKTVTNVGGSTKDIFTGKGNIGDFQKVIFSDLGNQIYDTTMGKKHPAVSDDPFMFDQGQFDSDRAAIYQEGQKQYDETLKLIPAEVANSINRSLPMLKEELNANGLLNSSAYGNEVARRQSDLAQNLVTQAVQGRQGFQTGALQRGLSLEDFVNQAKVAKSIGATMAPQVGNGKGTAVAGLGAGATAGTAVMPGWGTAIGAGLGYLGGGGMSSGRGK